MADNALPPDDEQVRGRWTMRDFRVRILTMLPLALALLLPPMLRAGWIDVPLGISGDLAFAAVLLVVVGYGALAWKMALVQYRRHPLGEPD